MASDTGPAHRTLPVSKLRPAYQQVADQLRELILTGSLAPEERLPNESELAANFGVSRSTFREGLRVLASQGLVSTSRGSAGGTFVARVEAEQVSQYLETSIGLMSGNDGLTLAEMLEARELLEVPAARLAAERRQQRHLDALQVALDRERLSRGRDDRFQEHRTFHTLIAEAAGNVLLVVMSEPVFRVLQGRFLNPSVPDRYWAEVDQDHEAILAAIERGDEEESARTMRDHLHRLRPAYDPSA